MLYLHCKNNLCFQIVILDSFSFFFTAGWPGMPLDIAVPTWYNDDSYINERKLTSATPSPNSALSKARSSLLDGFRFCQGIFWRRPTARADYQPWMGYANFVSNGNAENCSPNPLFNVMQYVTAKAAQLNSINYDGRNADNNPWTAQNVLDFSMPMTSPPGIISRPPASSKTSIRPTRWIFPTFWPARRKSATTSEFDGRNDWDEQAVLDYYQGMGSNAVMVAVSASDPNVVAVPEAEQVTPPVGFTPGASRSCLLTWS